MTEVPADIAKTAHAITEEHGSWLLLEERQDLAAEIASALLSERTRCVEAVRRATALDENGYIAEKDVIINEIMKWW